MAHKDNNYALIPKSQFAERLTKGFSPVKPSTDGEWIICDQGDQDTFDWVNLDMDTVPQWMKDLGVTSHLLTYAVAKKVARTKASGEGQSDGYWWQEDV